MNLEIQEPKNFTSDEIKFADMQIFKYVEDGDVAGLNDYLMAQFMMSWRRS